MHTRARLHTRCPSSERWQEQLVQVVGRSWQQWLSPCAWWHALEGWYWASHMWISGKSVTYCFHTCYDIYDIIMLCAEDQCPGGRPEYLAHNVTCMRLARERFSECFLLPMPVYSGPTVYTGMLRQAAVMLCCKPATVHLLV